MSIRIAIMGYGNLGRGIECAITQNPDLELVAIFTRRPPESVKALSGAKVYHADRILDFKRDIDGWSKIAKNLYIWDYTTNFHKYMLPFPNLKILHKLLPITVVLKCPIWKGFAMLMEE